MSKRSKKRQEKRRKEKAWRIEYEKYYTHHLDQANHTNVNKDLIGKTEKELQEFIKDKMVFVSSSLKESREYRKDDCTYLYNPKQGPLNAMINSPIPTYIDYIEIDDENYILESPVTSIRKLSKDELLQKGFELKFKWIDD